MLTRRNLLALPAALALKAQSAPPIRKIEAFNAPYGVTSYFRFLPKPQRPSVFVKITCEDGSFGWGQSVPLPTWSYETPESVLSSINSYLAPALTGKNPFQIEEIHLAMKKAIASSYSTGAPIAKAGIDLALHDLMGKLTGRSVSELWARPATHPVELSWTVNARSMKEAAELFQQGTAKGFQHFNLKVAPNPDFDLELVKAARTHSPKGFLWVDANGGYDLATAMGMARRFADLGVNVFEQPIAPNRLSGLVQLKKLGALPIILDEGVVSSVDLMEFIRLDALDGVAMKPARTAGLWDARLQVELLQDSGLLFLGSGLTDPDVSLAASLHLFSAYGLKFPAALNGLQFLSGSYLKQPFALEDGYLKVPECPGLGVTVDEARIAQGKAS